MQGQPLKLRTAQIGRCGELLVQYRLLRIGVESAPMTTDSGIDLVAYSPSGKDPKTIQVKTNLKPKPGGGKGRPALDWWLAQSNPAQLVALVDITGSRVWLLERGEMNEFAQQNPEGRLHFYMYTDDKASDDKARLGQKQRHVRDFDHLLLESSASKIFGIF